MLRKNLLVLILVLSIIQSVTAQSRFSFGINLYPNLSQRVFEKNSSRKSPKFSYSAGLFSRYKISKRFDASLGLNYTNTGYAWGRGSLLDYDGNLVGHTHGFTSDISITVPLDLHFNIPLKKNFVLSLSAGTGIKYIFDVKAFSVWHYDNGNVIRHKFPPDEINYINRLNIPVRLGVKLERPITKHLNLYAQPMAELDALNRHKASIYNTRLLNYGLSIGCVWH